jgi:hypothetical protein
MDERMKEVDKLKDEARKFTAKANDLLTQIQIECVHPYAELEFRYGATTSHVGLRTHHSMVVKCKLCQATYNNELVYFEDP